MCDKSFANGPNLSRHKRQVHKVESTYFYFSVKINIIEKSGEIKIRMRTLNIVNTDTFISGEAWGCPVWTVSFAIVQDLCRYA